MKIYFQIIFFLGLIWGQSSSSLEQSEVITERYSSNGLKKTVMVFEGAGINEIKVAEYGFFENGLKSYIKSFNNNALNGKSIRWYDNGNKAYEGNFKNNMKNGLHQSWFFDGSLENTINYSDDNLNGEYQEFHTNGNVLVKGNYENGQKEGLWISYYDNGEIQEKTNFKDGKLDGLKTAFLKNGDTKEEMIYRNNKKWTGTWVLNHSNGQKSVEGKYENGKGFVTEWFNTGDIYKKIDYNNDKIVGETIYRYFKNWEKKSIERLEDNKKNGLWTNWNEKGEKIKEGKYINNLMEGEWYFSYLLKDSSNWRSAKVNYQAGNGTNPNQNSGIPENGRVGKFESWYDNGKKALEYYYNDDGSRDSEKLTKRWYKNGNKWSEGYNTTINNMVVNIGKYTMWHRNGNKAWEYYYNDDGTRDSEKLTKRWHKNGNKRYEGYQATVIDKIVDVGKYTSWYENGQKDMEYYFNDDGTRDSGKLTSRWYEDGSKWYEGYVLSSNDKSLWNGLYKAYYNNGNLKSRGKYDKGKKTGEWTYWYEDGQTKQQV